MILPRAGLYTGISSPTGRGLRHVLFTPDSGHSAVRATCPLRAISGLMPGSHLLTRFFVPTIPGHEAPRRPIQQQFEANAEGGEQQHADEGLVVMVGARIIEDVVAEPAGRYEEFC